MCGISGIIGNQDESVINTMLDKIKRRGDSLPHYDKINNALLGSVHLKIVDHNNGGQPIYNEDKTLAIVFNGEIYNYLELKKNLVDKRHVFNTICDTEVLIHLYEEYQEDMLQYLDGMFAFLIFDSKNNSFFAARDYFGVKPFFYCWNQGIFYFSSEMKSFSEIPTNEIQELRPAHYIKDGFVNRFYNYSLEIKEIPFAEAKKKVSELVDTAIKKRVQTTLPIGVFFSGGIDSTITLLLCKKYHSNVTALILGDDNAEDVKFAKKVCNEFNIQFQQRGFDKEKLFQSIPQVIYSIESFEPNPVRGSVLSCLLGELAHEMKLKVVLCGEGSDEIFGGYGDFIFIEDEREFQNLSLNLLNDLYRTQLLRVDKTAMAFEVEVREPFLDKHLVEFAMSLPLNFKVNCFPNGKKTTKYILREAFKNILPQYIYERPKMTLMEGAGAGSVDRGKGMFFEHANSMMSDEEFENIRNVFSDYSIRDKEEAYYFKLFNQYFPKAKFASKRTFNAQKEILQNEN